MSDEGKAVCFNCNGTGRVPDMSWIKSATDEELDDPQNNCWVECPACHGTGYC